MRRAPALLIALATLVGGLAAAPTQDVRNGLLRRFDADGDGRLDASEREAARTYLQRERQLYRPSAATRAAEDESFYGMVTRLRAELDRNGDGELDAAEVASARELWRSRREAQALALQRGPRSLPQSTLDRLLGGRTRAGADPFEEVGAAELTRAAPAPRSGGSRERPGAAGAAAPARWADPWEGFDAARGGSAPAEAPAPLDPPDRSSPGAGEFGPGEGAGSPARRPTTPPIAPAPVDGRRPNPSATGSSTRPGAPAPLPSRSPARGQSRPSAARPLF